MSQLLLKIDQGIQGFTCVLLHCFDCVEAFEDLRVQLRMMDKRYKKLLVNATILGGNGRNGTADIIVVDSL